MYQFNPNNLIQLDFQELSKALAYIFATLQENESKISEVKATSTEAVFEISKHKEKFKDIESKFLIFEESIKEVNKISDKVNTWGERFREMEERNFAFSSKIEELSHQFQSQIDEVTRLISQTTRSAQIDTKRDVMIKMEEMNNAETVKIGIINSQLERQISELKNQLEMLNLENQAKFVEIHSSLGLVSSQTQQPESQKQPKESQKNRNVVSRLASLEKTFQNFVTSMSSTRSVGNTNQEIQIPAFIEPKINLIENEPKPIFSMVNEGIDLIKPASKENESNPPSPLYLPNNENLLPLFDRISKLEKANYKLGDYEAMENKIEILNEKIEILFEKALNDANIVIPSIQIEAPKEHHQEKSLEKPYELNLITIPSPIPSPSMSPMPSPRTPRLDSLYDKKFSKIEEAVQLLQKNITEVQLSIDNNKLKEYLDDKFTVFGKNTRDTLVKQFSGVSEEVSSKLSEFQSRLNGFWKDTQIVHEIIETIKSQIEESAHSLKEENKLLSSSIEDISKSIDIKLTEKLTEVKELIPQVQVTKEKPEQTESDTVLRSMIFSLRNELTKLRSSIEQIEHKRMVEESIFEENASTVFVENFGTKDENNNLKGILKLHDNAIRNLALKIMPGSQMPSQQNQEITNVLQYLEDLKSQIKEVINKQEHTKSFTSKDFELLNEIYQNLENKSNKSELIQKVDRNELRRIYQLLKKRIDELSEQLKKSDQMQALLSTQEEPYFMKKKYDFGCASCGQVFSPQSDTQMTQQTWYKPGTRNGTFMPGFSNILSSLIQSPSGSFTLPSRAEENIDRESIKSPKNSIVTPSYSKGKNRRIRLPSVKESS
ncbi:unnamed protein product [Blepharisma stoltei]|uniref:Uncharacterized protein n=1 Tax=Blepharisma stoltei TaxID=1481888 RepID=A0AAU9I560_9CILI|nr:unnamed protein product [Blepharisma stoltei]